MGGLCPIEFNFNGDSLPLSASDNIKIRTIIPVLTDMDANKGRFAEIFPVVTTAYKSTPLMDFVAVLMVLHYH